MRNSLLRTFVSSMIALLLGFGLPLVMTDMTSVVYAQDGDEGPPKPFCFERVCRQVYVPGIGWVSVECELVVVPCYEERPGPPHTP